MSSSATKKNPSVSETAIRPLCLHIITGLNDGGAEAVLFNLIQSAKGFRHSVISLMGPGKYGGKLEALGVHVQYLNLSPNFPSPLKLLKLKSYVKNVKPDVVQTWMYHADLFGGFASWHAGYKSIVWGLHHTTLHPKDTKWTTRQVVKFNAKISTWLPTKIISCSKKGDGVHRDIGYPDDKMVVVHNGYDTSRFIPDDLARQKIRDEFKIADDQLLLGCVARYNPQKDHDNLIRGFSHVVMENSNAHLLLIGPGLDDENIMVVKLIETLGLMKNVTLVGPRSDIPFVMNGLDLHVLGSAFGEAFPNVLSEAMSTGTMCVATDVGDSATIVGDTGKIVPPRDPKALAEAILELAPITDSVDLKNACRNRILNNFTLSHMTQGYQAVWQDAMLRTQDCQA